MNQLVKYDPFEEIRALQRRFFGDDLLAPLATNTIPATDVYTKDNQMVIETHLPKFTDNDIDIQVENNNLIISAEKHEKETDKSKKYIVRESSNSFYRSISLPERADSEKIAANLIDGILTITIPLSPLPEPKKISVNTNK